MNARRLRPLALAAAAAALAATQPVITNIQDDDRLRDSVDITADPAGANPIVVRWNAVQFNEDSIGRRYQLRLVQGAPPNQTVVNVPVPGEPAQPSATVPADQVAEGGWRMTVRAIERDCITRDAVTNACTAHAPAGDATVTISPLLNVTIDRTGPAAASVALNGGSPFTNQRTVIVNGTAEDALSGVERFQVGTTPSFACEGEASCPRPLEAFEYTLPEDVADGPVTVYARFFDRARLVDPPPIFFPPGNPSATVSDTIFLDRKAPTATAAATTPTTVTAGQSVSFTAAGSSDDGDGPDDSGLDPTGTRWDPGDGSGSLTGAQVTHTYSRPGEYVATLTVRDNAGNEDSAPVAVVVTPATVAGGPPPVTTPVGGGTVTPPAGGTTTLRSLTGSRVVGTWRARTANVVRVTLTRRARVQVRLLRVLPGNRTRVVARLTRTLNRGTTALRLRPATTGVHRVVVVAGTTTLTRTVRVQAQRRAAR
jgi:hypothetical protein